MLVRLRRRSRFDTLQNEIRARGRSWGRWIYLGLLAALAIWIGDMFFGNLIYFRAEGLVMRDRVVLATQYPAEVVKLNVHEGSQVKKGEVLAEVRSQQVEETLAQLYAEAAQGISKATDLEVRAKVYDEISPMVKRRMEEATDALNQSETLRNQSLLTTSTRAELIKDELDSRQQEAQIRTERATIEKNLPKLQMAVDASRAALSRLQESYAGGLIRAPADGVVGYLTASAGTVIKPGDEIMELFTGKPYILAYVPDGTLYTLSPGDKVNIRIGFDRYSGYVQQIYPVAGELPKEFQNTFQPVARAQIVRIEFDPGQPNPVLFSKTRLTSAEWLPGWVEKAIGRPLHAAEAWLGDHWPTSRTAPQQHSAPDAS